ncbi:MAG: class I SAM-dependent rRNA methyltransferase [Acidobacteria bacterium]|nr:class I SAM-dependent rRNA methyltransferase [Acidobacteriota bacterium]
MDPFSIENRVQVSARAVKRLRKGHLWIYASDVAREPEGAAPAMVQVVDGAGNPLGYAFYSRHSQIRLRLISRSEDLPTPEFFRARIENAIARRRNLIREGSACRLVFGEGDLLPAVIVDRYDRHLVLQTLSYGADALKPFLADTLREILQPAGIMERNDVKARRLEGLDETQGILYGNVPDEVEIQENGIRFLVNMRLGQKTGFFLDQSRNRISGQMYASGRALDCFTNTGAFALHFARSCESVLAVDISADSLAMAKRNRDINNSVNVRFDEGNAFDYLRELESAGQSFNTICLDPPAFAKNRKALSGARKGYKEINLRAIKLLKPEGILITSSCSYHMPESNFLKLLCEAARDAHRYIQVIEMRGQSSDHPMLSGMPETKYLKCFILRVL